MVSWRDLVPVHGERVMVHDGYPIGSTELALQRSDKPGVYLDGHDRALCFD